MNKIGFSRRIKMPTYWFVFLQTAMNHNSNFEQMKNKQFWLIQVHLLEWIHEFILMHSIRMYFVYFPNVRLRMLAPFKLSIFIRCSKRYQMTGWWNWFKANASLSFSNKWTKSFNLNKIVYVAFKERWHSGCNDTAKYNSLLRMHEMEMLDKWLFCKVYRTK